METTIFDRAVEEGYYVSSNAPANGEFVPMAEVKGLQSTIATLQARVEEMEAELRWLKGVYPNHPEYKHPPQAMRRSE